MSAQISNENFFNNLRGTWNIKRNFNGGSAEGRASFSMKDSPEKSSQNILNYKENLTVKFDNSSVVHSDSHQEYCFIYSKTTDQIEKYTSDKKLMYSMGLFCGVGKGEYICEEDIYHATYTFVSEDQFILEYVVSGPKKNYKITTEFTKIRNDSEVLGSTEVAGDFGV